MRRSFSRRARSVVAGLLLAAGLLGPLTGKQASAQVALEVQARSQTAGAFTLQMRGVAAAGTEIDGQELVIRFARPIAPEGVEQAALGFPEWIETIEYGYDSLVVRFGPSVRFSAEATDRGVTVAADRPDPEPSPSASAAADPQRIRLNYYRALTLIESGAVAEGRALLVGLLRADPRNIEVILLTARAEEQLGRPRRAVALYDRALALDPRLPFAIRDRQRLARDLADTARISTRYQDVENGETQIITILDGRLFSARGPTLSFSLENRFMEAGTLTRPDGSTGSFEGDRQRGTLTLTAPREGDFLTSASLYASNDVAGVGAALDIDRGDSRYGFEARWSEPDYNFVEGIVYGGARDRIAADWQWLLDETYEVSAGGTLNRYSLDGDHAGAGVGLTFGVRRYLPEWWALSSVGYQFDAEYILNAQDNPATGDDRLPLSSREGHTVDATAERRIGDYARVQGLVGYTYDRLNGGGPLSEVTLIYDPLVDLEIVTTLGTSINESRGTQNQLFYIELSLRTRF